MDPSRRSVELPRRGKTRVCEVPGPPGAPVLVLLHGLAATAMLNWGPSLVPLGRGFRVLAPDLRGHGGGLRVRGRFRLETCADDAVALADALGIERVIPVGYSMGGPVAQLVWKRHPERVAGLVLCATTGRFADRRRRRAASALAPLLSLAAKMAPKSFWQDAAQRWVGGAAANPAVAQRIQAELSGTNPASVVEAAGALARFDSGTWIGKVDVPTAVVVPALDEHVPPVRQLALADSIPNASVYQVDGDHYVCVARPDLFVPVLFEACKSVAVRDPVRVIS